MPSYIHEMTICEKWRSSVKKFENRFIFGEVMGKSLVSCFLTHCVWDVMREPSVRAVPLTDLHGHLLIAACWLFQMRFSIQFCFS